MKRSSNILGVFRRKGIKVIDIGNVLKGPSFKTDPVVQNYQLLLF